MRGRGEFQSSRGHHYHHITAFHLRPILRCLNSWMGGSNVNIWGIWKHHSNQLAIDGVGVIIVCQCFSPSPPKDSLMQQQYCDQEYERAVIFRLGRLIQAREDSLYKIFSDFTLKYRAVPGAPEYSSSSLVLMFIRRLTWGQQHTMCPHKRSGNRIQISDDRPQSSFTEKLNLKYHVSLFILSFCLLQN